MTLSNYSMSCYKLPTSLRKQIENKMDKCWWENKDNRRKIHWAKWEKLTEGKAAGGLEFRDMRSMNDALLPK